MENIKVYTRKITKEFLESPMNNVMENIESDAPKCPRCGRAMRITDKVVSCPDREGCNWFMWRSFCGKTLSENQIRKLLETGSAGKVKGLKRKDGSSFEAEVLLDIATGKLGLPERESPPPSFASLPAGDYRCPKCGAAMVDDGGKLSCRNGCGFSLWKSCWGHALTEEEIGALLGGGRTGVISGFVSPKSGKSFDAALRLDKESWKIVPVFPEGKDESGDRKQEGASVESLHRCPSCGKPLLESDSHFECQCGFRLWKSTFGHRFCKEDLLRLLRGEKTLWIDGLVSPRTKKTFSARFTMDAKTGKLDMEFPER